MEDIEPAQSVLSIAALTTRSAGLPADRRRRRGGSDQPFIVVNQLGRLLERSGTVIAYPVAMISNQSSVLIVDNDAAARSGLAQLIAGAGFRVTTAADGREAIDTLDREAHDMMLLDIWMPHMDGLQVLGELKSRPVRPKVIVMTGDDTTETVLLSLQRDAYQFITKPIELQPLLRLLHGVKAAPAEASSIVVLSARAGWVELLAPCAPEVIDRIEHYVANLQSDLPDEVRASVGTVLRELLLDAMGGDGHFDPQRRVRIACLRAKHMLMFRIADAGYGFRAADAATGDAGDRIGRTPVTAAAGGMLRPGMLIAQQLADELLVNEARDEVVFVKYLD
jgi:CheY-like chemotaxis protein/anti-sigma regulatory factor (Ser/Thr protein kinase)